MQQSMRCWQWILSDEILYFRTNIYISIFEKICNSIWRFFIFRVVISLINFQKSKRKWHWTKRVGTLLVRVVLYHLTSSPPPLRQMIAAPDTVNLIVILNNSLSFTSSFQNNEWNIATLIISVQHFVRYYNVIREQ